MRLARIVPAVLLAVLTVRALPAQAPPTPPAGTRLSDLAWPAAEARLTRDTVVVLPLGAAAEQHGPHLRLGNDALLADYLTHRILEGSDVVAAPPLGYSYSPAFQEYPGSVSIPLHTARDLTADIVRSLAGHGPRRFYVLNTSTSATPALAAAAALLAPEGILLRHTDLHAHLEAARIVVRHRAGGHADEVETSMMLYVDGTSVDMSRAVRDAGPPSEPFRLTRRAGAGTYSPSGVWGDPTLATYEKGRALVESLLSGIRADIEETRRAALPVASGGVPPLPRPAGAPGAGAAPAQPPDGCLDGDDRAIRSLGWAFSLAWSNQDAGNLAGLWEPGGDMLHPDGFVERSAQTIRQNRAALFMRAAYRGSRHDLTIGLVRCVTSNVAVADCKWELRGVSDGTGQPLPPADGLCTLVLKRRAGGWGIEAYRYTMNPASGTSAPVWLNRPGMPQLR